MAKGRVDDVLNPAIPAAPEMCAAVIGDSYLELRRLVNI